LKDPESLEAALKNTIKEYFDWRLPDVIANIESISNRVVGFKEFAPRVRKQYIEALLKDVIDTFNKMDNNKKKVWLKRLEVPLEFTDQKVQNNQSESAKDSFIKDTWENRRNILRKILQDITMHGKNLADILWRAFLQYWAL